MSSIFLEETSLRTYTWLDAGAEQFAEMREDASKAAALQMQKDFAKALDAVMQFPCSGGTPITVKGVLLHKQLSGNFILLSRYDESLDEVELVGFYYQNSSYHASVAAIL